MSLREIPGSLQGHFGNTTTTLATIWEIIRKDSEHFRFTDADIELNVNGNIFVPINSGTTSAIESSVNPNSDNLSIQHILDSEYITVEDLSIGLFDHAEVNIYLVNFRDTSQGWISIFRGFFGEVTMRDDVSAEVELKSLSTVLEQKFGRVYTYHCDAQLGDGRCGITNIWDHDGVVDQVTSNMKFYDNDLNIDVEYGIVEFTSGYNEGVRREVRRYINDIPIHSVDIDKNSFSFTGNLSDIISAGETFEITNSSGNDGTYTVADIEYEDRYGKMTKDGSNYYTVIGILYNGIQLDGDPYNLQDGDSDTDEISQGDTFTIKDSEEYNGEYEVSSTEYSNGITTLYTYEFFKNSYYVGYTIIFTEENISDSTPDGKLVFDAQGMIELWFPAPFKIQVGDEFKASEGCDKTFTTCKEKFNNYINFRGFPHIPGKDEINKYKVPER